MEFILLHTVILICLVWGLIKERNYPLYYRLLFYSGCFLFFYSFTLVLAVGKWLGVNSKMIANVMPLLMGVGSFSAGIATQMLPEIYDVKYKKKRYWKVLVFIGVFLIFSSLLSIIFLD